jgi:WD40 repeat protein
MMDPQSNFKTNHGQFPTELLLSIFIYIDGLTLTSCKQVCRHWSQVITHYDDLIWSNACHRDFEPKSRRFWSLQFPPPVRKRQWQDMYRITKNWYNGYAKGNYITVKPTSDLEACTVIGTPQEQGLYTTLTLAHDGRVIRSNPNYNSRIQQHQQQQQRQQRQSLMVQSPLSPQQKFFLDASSNHLARWTADDATNSLSIVCHYTDPSSKWLVTGGLNGAVSVWDLETKTLVRVWHGHRGRVLCINMNNEGKSIVLKRLY